MIEIYVDIARQDEGQRCTTCRKSRAEILAERKYGESSYLRLDDPVIMFTLQDVRSYGTATSTHCAWCIGVALTDARSKREVAVAGVEAEANYLVRLATDIRRVYHSAGLRDHPSESWTMDRSNLGYVFVVCARQWERLVGRPFPMTIEKGL